MIKAIIFDFFGVICSDEYWKFVREDKNMEGKFHQLANDVNLGHIDWEGFMKKVANETGQSIETVRVMYQSERVNPQLLTYIENLHQKYKTALLTNAHHEFFEPLAEKAHLDKVFDEIVISSRVGIIKPDPRIYEYALQKLGVNANEAVFIDDSVARVEGAKKAGIGAILYKNFDQLKEELDQILTAGADN